MQCNNGTSNAIKYGASFPKMRAQTHDRHLLHANRSLAEWNVISTFLVQCRHDKLFRVSGVYACEWACMFPGLECVLTTSPHGCRMYFGHICLSAHATAKRLHNASNTRRMVPPCTIVIFLTQWHDSTEGRAYYIYTYTALHSPNKLLIHDVHTTCTSVSLYRYMVTAHNIELKYIPSWQLYGCLYTVYNT